MTTEFTTWQVMPCQHGTYGTCNVDDCEGPLTVQHPTLFDQEAGLTAKEKGMAQALDHAKDEWKKNFRAAVFYYANEGTPFTSEDVTQITGLPRGAIGKDINNSVGAMMNGMSRKGVIQKTGQRVLSKRPSSHSAELTEWVGAK